LRLLQPVLGMDPYLLIEMKPDAGRPDELKATLQFGGGMRRADLPDVLASILESLNVLPAGVDPDVVDAVGRRIEQMEQGHDPARPSWDDAGDEYRELYRAAARDLLRIATPMIAVAERAAERRKCADEVRGRKRLYPSVTSRTKAGIRGALVQAAKALAEGGAQ
jgi:hypothetical protein